MFVSKIYRVSFLVAKVYIRFVRVCRCTYMYECMHAGMCSVGVFVFNILLNNCGLWFSCLSKREPCGVVLTCDVCNGVWNSLDYACRQLWIPVVCVRVLVAEVYISLVCVCALNTCGLWFAFWLRGCTNHSNPLPRYRPYCKCLEMCFIFIKCMQINTCVLCWCLLEHEDTCWACRGESVEPACWARGTRATGTTRDTAVCVFRKSYISRCLLLCMCSALRVFSKVLWLKKTLR